MFLYDTPPCAKCDSRYMACHAKCEKYQKWKIEHGQRRKKVNKQIQKENDIINYQISVMNKCRKNRG